MSARASWLSLNTGLVATITSRRSMLAAPLAASTVAYTVLGSVGAAAKPMRPSSTRGSPVVIFVHDLP